MPQAYYDESAANTPAAVEPVATPDDAAAKKDLYTFEGFTVESNTKVLLIPKMQNSKHG